MSVFERNGYWYVEVSLPNGKKLKRSVGKKGIVTKAVAKQLEEEWRRKIKLGQLDMSQDIPTLNDFIPVFIAYLRDIKQNRAWKQGLDALRNIAKLYGNKRLSEISTSDIEDYKSLRIRAGRKPATVNKELTFLRHLLNYAKRCKKLYGDNVVSICGLLPVNNQKTRVITIEEEALLLANADEPLKSMVQIALLTGLRLTAISTLKWDYVDFNANRVTVEAIYSKNKRVQIIPMSAALKLLLLETKLKSKGSEYVLPKAACCSEGVLSRHFTELCKRIGLQGVRFHDLRHTAATRMIESGVSIVAVSKILGHSDIKMTMRYAHPDISLKEAVEKLASFATNFTTTESQSTDIISGENKLSLQ